jgi:hypothetical protein
MYVSKSDRKLLTDLHCNRQMLPQGQVSRPVKHKPTNKAGLLYCIYSSPLSHLIYGMQIQYAFMTLSDSPLTWLLCHMLQPSFHPQLPSYRTCGWNWLCVKIVPCLTCYRILLLLSHQLLLMERLPSLCYLLAVTVALLRCWSSAVDIVTRLQAWWFSIRILSEARDVSLLQHV